MAIIAGRPFRSGDRPLHILIVDDDADFRGLLVRGLSHRHRVDEVDDGEGALWFLKAHRPDMVLLDMTMPGMCGLDVCRRMRATGNSTPVLMVTSTADGSKEAELLHGGADGFVPKQRGLDAIVAHAEALARRPGGRAPSAAEVGPMSVDVSFGKVMVDGVEVAVRRQELLLLDFLARRPGEVVSLRRLAHFLGDIEGSASPEACRQVLTRTRKALAGTAAEGILVTHHSLGYSLDPTMARGKAAGDRPDHP